MRLCTFGYNYSWLAGDLLVAGFVLAAWPTTTQARTKRLSQHRKDLVTPDLLDAVRKRVERDLERERSAVEARQSQMVEEFRAKEGYRDGLLNALKPELRRSLSYLHDYKQFITQVTQNINVIIEQRYGGSADGKLAQATRAEQAIYWSAKMMEEKLKSASYLLAPERITDPELYTTFQFYKMVDKYRHIYAASFSANNVSLRMEGESYGSLRGNSEAIAIIPHTFIDNAYKYAPSDSRAEIRIEEDGERVRLAVSSFGPEIRPDERERIFELFYRGENARAISDGMGFGLYLARFIARRMDSDIAVNQVLDRKHGKSVWTTFSVAFERAQG